jgi:hypothetical protein
VPSHSQENRHCVRRCPKIVSRFHPLILKKSRKTSEKQIKNHRSNMDSDAKMTSYGRLEPASDQVLDYASIPPHNPNRSSKVGRQKNKNYQPTEHGGRYVVTQWWQCLIGSILPAIVVNAFRRGSLLSSSQQRPSKQIKKSNYEKKHEGTDPKKRKNKNKVSDGSVQRDNRHTNQLERADL